MSSEVENQGPELLAERKEVRVAPARFDEVTSLATERQISYGKAADELIRLGAAALANRKRAAAKAAEREAAKAAKKRRCRNCKQLHVIGGACLPMKRARANAKRARL